MTRPEDVALLRRLLATTRVFSCAPHELHIGLSDGDLSTLRSLASRLEGERRDEDPGIARFRLWLEGARRTTPTDQWERGYLDALRDVSTELNLALLASTPTTPSEDRQP